MEFNIACLYVNNTFHLMIISPNAFKRFLPYK